MIHNYKQVSTSQYSNLSCCKYVNRKNILVGNNQGSIILYCSPKLIAKTIYIDDEIVNCRPVVTSIALLGESFYATYINGLIRKWDIETQTCTLTLKECPGVLGVVANETSRNIVTFGYDSVIRLYNADNGKLIMNFRDSILSPKNQGHSSRIFAVRFHPHRELEFISAGWDNSLQYWDLRRINSVRSCRGPHICSGDGLNISPNGYLILTAAYQKYNSAQLRCYMRPDTNITNLLQEPNKMYGGIFINNNFVALASTNPGILYIINNLNQKLILRKEFPDNSICSLDNYLNWPKTNPNGFYTRLALIHGSTLTELRLYYNLNEPLIYV